MEPLPIPPGAEHPSSTRKVVRHANGSPRAVPLATGMLESTAMATPSQQGVVDDIAAVLTWLDSVVRHALGVMSAQLEPEAGVDPFRGLHIAPGEIARLLAQPPGEPLLGRREAASHLARVPKPRGLCKVAGAEALDDFELAVLLIASASELDLRYERFFAYLQDDVNKKRPTVDLALNLLCGSLADKLQHRRHFAADAPLLRLCLVHLAGDNPSAPGPLLGQVLRLDDQVLGALLGQDSLDRRLVTCSQLLQWPDLVSNDEPLGAALVALPSMAKHYARAAEPLRLYLQGPAGADKDDVVQTLAREIGSSLLQVDLPLLLATIPDVESALTLVFREARLKDGVLHLRRFDALQGPDQARARECLARHLARASGVNIVSGMAAWEPLEGPNCHLIPVHCAAPTAAQRTACWTGALGARGVTMTDATTLGALGERYQLSRQQIEGAVAHAIFQSRGRAAGGTDDSPKADDLFRAARQQTRHLLDQLAQRVESTRGWGDLVLSNDALAQMREICAQVVHRHRVMEDWGFGRKLPYGKGLSVLFAGPSGTGKTMAAEVLANELQLDLYKIDLARVVSKYIGETEQNLDRIFTAAQDANAILFFDEADALFGKRSEVKDAHDRYANLEISYLLQKMEQYEGVTILASNLRQNLDEAFVRRLAFIVHFAFPDEAQRRRLWQGVWPADTPLGADLDLDTLADHLRFSGGSIRNAALAAGFLASRDGRPVYLEHVRHAAEREFCKLGKAPTWPLGTMVVPSK